MIGAAKHINELVNSPYANAYYLLNFFQVYGEREKGLLAAYLVYPFVLHPDLSVITNGWRRMPSLLTVVDKYSEHFAGFAQRLERFRDDTNNSIILLAAARLIEVTETMGVRVLAPTEKRSGGAAARKLAVLIERHSLPSVYRCMGVKQL